MCTSDVKFATITIYFINIDILLPIFVTEETESWVLRRNQQWPYMDIFNYQNKWIFNDILRIDDN